MPRPQRIIEMIPESVFDEMDRKRKAAREKERNKQKVDQSWRQRYRQAKLDYDTRQNTAMFRDFGFIEPVYPKVATANGLQRMIEDVINWNGYRCTRVSVFGRMVGKKRIKSSTRKGSADLSSTINGRSVMWEVKVNKDKPSEEQLKEQEKERAAGGEYLFVKTPKEFFEKYDYLLSLYTVPTNSGGQ